MRTKIRWVEHDPGTGLSIRIFRSKKAAAAYFNQHPYNACSVAGAPGPGEPGYGGPILSEMELHLATDEIRRQVFTRDTWRCVVCGQPISWDDGEMDERQARGETVKKGDGTYQSGEVSVANCQTLCKSCHTSGPNPKHDRAPAFSKSIDRISVKPDTAISGDGWYHPLEPNIT